MKTTPTHVVRSQQMQRLLKKGHRAVVAKLFVMKHKKSKSYHMTCIKPSSSITKYFNDHKDYPKNDLMTMASTMGNYNHSINKYSMVIAKAYIVIGT